MRGDKERRAIIVLDKLNTVGRIDVDRDELRAAVRVAKAALAKRIPLRAEAEGNDDQDDFFCPQCKEPICSVSENAYWGLKQKFCEECGQALDWD